MWHYVAGLELPNIFNPLNAQSNPICHLLALLGAHHILHISRVRVKERSATTSKIEFSKKKTPLDPRALNQSLGHA